MCNEYTIKLLQNKTLGDIEIEQAFIKLKLQEYDWFLIIITYTNSL